MQKLKKLNYFRLPEIEASRIFVQIIEGLEHLHSQNIAFLDLKPEWILIDSNKNIKINILGGSIAYSEGKMIKFVFESPCYSSPQIIKREEYDPVKANIWSAGITLFAMVFGYLPFDDPVTKELYRKITRGEYQIPSHASDGAQDLIRRLLTVDAALRIDIAGIRKHPWFSLWSKKVVADQKVLDLAVEKYGLDAEAMKADVEGGKLSKLATTYYMLEKESVSSDEWTKPPMSPDGI